VAMTRAKQNLFLYCSYEKKDGLEAYLNTSGRGRRTKASRMLFKP
jgi:ATP-dependent exoDNAse (exonuclease V) beta subunit